MRLSALNSRNQRSGVILLVVLAMITLLTVLGITFVLYSDASESAARSAIEIEQTASLPDFTATTSAIDEFFLVAFRQLVFDVEDDEEGQQSAMRGHSMGRDMYGLTYGYSGSDNAGRIYKNISDNAPTDRGKPVTAYLGGWANGVPQDAPGQEGGNDRPFRGTGRLNVVDNGKDYNEMLDINFTTFRKFADQGKPADRIRDPERPGLRAPDKPSEKNRYVGGYNPPYTAPDLNHVFLAKLGPDGQVDEPSFVRREAMGTLVPQGQKPQDFPPFGNEGMREAFDKNQEYRYRILRPRAAENHPTFPGISGKKFDGWGDVKNLPWSKHNDAIWMDLGDSPRLAKDGKYYKPLYAFTVLDLDGRVNLNAHGNLNGFSANLTPGHLLSGIPALTHTSRHGGNPWEVSLAKLFTPSNPGWASDLPEVNSQKSLMDETYNLSPWRTVLTGMSQPWHLNRGVFVGGRFDGGLPTKFWHPINSPAISGKFLVDQGILPTPHGDVLQHSYGLLDFNGSFDPSHVLSQNTDSPNGDQPLFPEPIGVPGSKGNSPFPLWGRQNGLGLTPFGNFDPRVFGGAGVGEIKKFGSTADNTQDPIWHSAAFNPNINWFNTQRRGNRLFPNSEFAKVMAQHGYNGIDSDLWKLGLFNFSVNSNNLSRPYGFDGSQFITDPDGMKPFGARRDHRYERMTTLSWDMDRPGMVPYIRDFSSEHLAMRAPDPPNFSGDLYPRGKNTNIPALPKPPETPTNTNLPFLGKGEYNSLYQSTLAYARRLNLKKPLPPLPQPNPGRYPVMASQDMGQPDYIVSALKARHDFANEILDVLCDATGALKPPHLDPNLTRPSLTVDTDAYRATRWLAQLSANIVDFIDHDDAMTVFTWYQGQNPVFGVELSRLAINEVYAQVENDKNDVGKNTATRNYKGRFYLELVNPLPSNFPTGDPATVLGFDNHKATLKAGNQEVYILESTSYESVANLFDPYQKDSDKGVVGSAHYQDNTTAKRFWWPADLSVDPSDSGIGDVAGSANKLKKGFIVVGPPPDNNDMASGLKDLPRWQEAVDKKILVSGLKSTNPANNQPTPDDFFFEIENKAAAGTNNDQKIKNLLANQGQDTKNKLNQVILLRRLAIPGLAPNEIPGSPLYNPYVTVDFVRLTPDMFEENDARSVVYDTARDNDSNTSDFGATPITKRRSYGRVQPYHMTPGYLNRDGTIVVSPYGGLVPQSPIRPSDSPEEPGHTLWRHNHRDEANPKTYYPPFRLPSGFMESSQWKDYPSSPNESEHPTFETPRLRTHLDRAPATVGELLTVPTCRAHELLLLNDQNAQYCHGWLDPDTRLYRFLELAQAGDTRYALKVDQTAGNFKSFVDTILPESGRIPGKININTMSYEVFRSLVDYQFANRFTEAQVFQLWRHLQANRPYWGYGVGEYRNFLDGNNKNDLLGDSFNGQPVLRTPPNRFPQERDYPMTVLDGGGRRGVNLSFLRKHPGYRPWGIETTPDRTDGVATGSVNQAVRYMPYDAIDQLDKGLQYPIADNPSNNYGFNNPYGVFNDAFDHYHHMNLMVDPFNLRNNPSKDGQPYHPKLHNPLNPVSSGNGWMPSPPLSNHLPGRNQTDLDAMGASGPGEIDIPPSARMELLSKVMSNTTSRSNCFAVWVTVGFFEAEEASKAATSGQFTNRYILKDERNGTEEYRRKYFFMIDRTQLRKWEYDLDNQYKRPFKTLDSMQGAIFTPDGKTVSAPEPFGTKTVPDNNSVDGWTGDMDDRLTGQLKGNLTIRWYLDQLFAPEGLGYANWARGAGLAIYNPLTKKYYGIKEGDLLTICPVPQGEVPVSETTPLASTEETVEVKRSIEPGPNNGRLYVDIRRLHGYPFGGIGAKYPVRIVARGYPGPVPRDSADLQDLTTTGLVPYFVRLPGGRD